MLSRQAAFNIRANAINLQRLITRAPDYDALIDVIRSRSSDFDFHHHVSAICRLSQISDPTLRRTLASNIDYISLMNQIAKDMGKTSTGLQVAWPGVAALLWSITLNHYHRSQILKQQQWQHSDHSDHAIGSAAMAGDKTQHNLISDRVQHNDGATKASNLSLSFDDSIGVIFRIAGEFVSSRAKQMTPIVASYLAISLALSPNLISTTQSTAAPASSSMSPSMLKANSHHPRAANIIPLLQQFCPHDRLKSFRVPNQVLLALASAKAVPNDPNAIKTVRGVCDWVVHRKDQALPMHLVDLAWAMTACGLKAKGDGTKTLLIIAITQFLDTRLSGLDVDDMAVFAWVLGTQLGTPRGRPHPDSASSTIASEESSMRSKARELLANMREHLIAGMDRLSVEDRVGALWSYGRIDVPCRDLVIAVVHSLNPPFASQSNQSAAQRLSNIPPPVAGSTASTLSPANSAAVDTTHITSASTHASSNSATLDGKQIDSRMVVNTAGLSYNARDVIGWLCEREHVPAIGIKRRGQLELKDFVLDRLVKLDMYAVW
jgi:hypothetical protein